MVTDDEIFISTLKTIAQSRLQPTAGELRPDPELRAALAAAFGRPSYETASEGELARAALDLLRQDPDFAEPIQMMASQAGERVSRQRYIEPVTITLAAAALLVLQTRVKFKLDSNHKWSIEIDKKSSGDTAVKLLVERLLPFLGKWSI